MNIIKLNIFVLSFLALSSCKTVSSDQQSTAKHIQEYANTITAGELKKHLDIVASDEMEGRETGSDGQK